MKILIFGDSHLSPTFNKSKLEKMKKLFSNVDMIIINGDLWDSAYWNFNEFIDSKWSELFKTLSEKKTIYLYGNHDREYMCDKRVNLFSQKQGKVYNFDFNHKKVYVTHGDAEVYGAHLYKLPDFIEKFLWRIGNLIEATLVKIFGKKVLKIQHQNTNNRFKAQKLKKYGKDLIVVYNHTHVQEKDDETNCYNTGCMKYGIFQYVIFNTDTSQVKFYDETYEL